ncbi:MAG: acyl-CoA-binding protein [Gammaproteobacteria bacterium]|nr:acyl-CoA-binding protein [Gammaproteobacteria bacterium]
MSEDIKAKFAAAAVAAKDLKTRPGNEAMLELYALYKQATDGDISGERPGGFDFVGGAKYDAWSGLKGISTGDAMERYIAKVESLKS